MGQGLRGRMWRTLRRRFAGPVLALLLASALASCKSGPTVSSAESDLAQAAASGYRPEQAQAFDTWSDTWTYQEGGIDLALLLPRSAAPAPLVLYLPELGQPARSATLWREAWARAGYAVLSVQPEAAGPAVLSSAPARGGDFRTLAREASGRRSLQRRLDVLGSVYAGVRRRAAAGTMPFARIDPATIVLAGCDLGSQAALVLAGAGAPELNVPELPVQALILLSPRPDAGAAALLTRIAAVRVPVLAATASADADPFGLLSDPEERRGVWEALSPGAKYQLVLLGGSHALLGGNSLFEVGATGELSTSASRSGRHGPRGGASGADSAATGLGAQRAPTGRPFDSRQLAAVQVLSTAFLDATVARRPAAQSWLERDAPGWVQTQSRLVSK
jgi:hypothetical protein